ncbi:MAG TPA: hypothetical protein VKS21_00520, partial [Spirochaetota bacterium]|nr:hypothetical protein [Spirochaetota bacterium]
MKFAVQSVADKLGLTLKGNKNNSFDNVADIRFPEKNCLLYIAAEKYLEKALNAAAVFLIAAELEPRITINNNKTYLFSKQPKLDLVKLLHLIEEHSAYKHNKENFTYAPGNIIINKYSDIAEDAL